MLGSSIDKPLMESPSAGGQLAGGQRLPALLNTPITTPRGGPKTDDPIRQGFFDSEFYKPNAPTTTDVVNYTYQGKPMTGSSSNISQFQKYLDSIGKGDLIQRNDQLFSQETGPLAQIGGGIPRPPGFDLNYGRRSNNPSDPILSLNPDFTPSFDLKQADPNNLLTGATPPIGGGTFNGVPLFPFPGMNNTEIASASDQRGIPSILGINPMGQQSSFEQTFNDKQGLDRYVDDLVNERLKDIFGGIMGAINV